VPELAEEIVREGKADIVALGRALLSDPHWPKKVLEGKVEDIRPCIGCYDGCMGRMAQFKPLSCATNPATGRERLYAIVATSRPRPVLIAGAGVAGMEAARAAAIRGDDVTLYERSEKIGGHLIAGSVPVFKQDIKRLLDWYKTQLKKLKVRVELNREVTPDVVRKQGPEKVIISTGSKPIIPNLPGIERPHVATCIDLLLGKKKAGDSVVVMGGGLVGCETGLWLSLQGKRVTIVEMLPELATGLFASNRTMLLAMLAQGKVHFIVRATIEEITDECVKIIDRDFKRSEVRCNTVALALGLEPQRELYESLKNEMAEVYMIGDCKESANILRAIWDGYMIGRC
jgi:2-enoate reductase